MSYQYEKKRAYAVIDEQYSLGKSTDEIVFKIQSQFGMGRKVVEERLDLIERLQKKTHKN